MRNGIFYHFLQTKEQEDENNRRNLEIRLLDWEIVGKNNRAPTLLHLFPYELKKNITFQDLEIQPGLELNGRKVKEFILKYWDDQTRERLILSGEQIPILMRDMDTNTEHYIFFAKCPSRDMYLIQGYWFTDFVVRRNLRVGMTIGMYWDTSNSVLRFSVLSDD